MFTANSDKFTGNDPNELYHFMSLQYLQLQRTRRPCCHREPPRECRALA